MTGYRRRRGRAGAADGAQRPAPRCRRGLAPAAGAVLLTLLFFVGAAVAGFFVFVGTLPRGPADATTRTDAIVVLTGGAERVVTGIHLLEQGLARHLFISGVGPGVSRDELLRRIDREDFDLRQRIVLGHTAGDTAGNARETAEWMHRQQYRSMRLVTSQYHLPRSRAIFGWAMPHVEILPHPVFSEAVKQDEWWLWPGTTRLFVQEYAKFVAAAAYVWLVPSPNPA